VISFVETYNFQEDLHLFSYDPKGFVNMLEKVKRLEKRASTLFIKELQKGRRGKLLDRNDYGRKYVGLSKYYIHLSKQYQPNTVSAFNELVSIFPVETDLQRISNVSKFYDVFKITGTPSTPQFIYYSFIAHADSVLERQEYLNALNLIRNANVIESFFKTVQKSESYANVYSSALNGLLSSFLKVSIMAYKSRNFKVAKRYYMQAQQIFIENADLISHDYRVRNSFNEFVDTQIDLANMFLDDKYYEDAVLILDQTYEVGHETGLNLDDIDFKSAYTKAYGGIYKKLVDSIEFYIEKENRSNSLSALLNSASFEQTHTDYIKRDERVTSYAQLLVDDIISRGASELGGRSPEKAMDYLLDAKHLSKTFQLNNANLIDSIISKAAIPIIMNLVGKASFKVWANRLDEANKLKAEAEQLIKKYNLQNIPEINSAIYQLDDKINNRICVDLQYKVDHAVKLFLNRINSGKYNEAQLNLEKIYFRVNEFPHCEINTTYLDSISERYSPLFNFLNKYDSLLNIIGTTSFSNIKLLYADLEKVFYDHNLNQYIERMPSLIHLMKQTGDVAAYFEAIEFYIGKENYMNAYEYLHMLKLNDIKSKETKQYQKLIGYGICQKKEDAEIFIKSLTNDDKWFRVLVSECLKN
jgi:hypothetical protein